MCRIQCKCGAIQGHIQGKGVCNRFVCYCADCQAFTKFLGCSDQVLDPNGGTKIMQVAQPRLIFSKGRDLLAAVRLSEKGLVRWYASCCKTPIGNTHINPKISHVGLIHSSLDLPSMDKGFGKNVAKVFVSSATGEPKPKAKGQFSFVLRFLWIVLSTRIGNRYKKSQLFSESGVPVVNPAVLSAEEIKDLKRTV